MITEDKKNASYESLKQKLAFLYPEQTEEAWEKLNFILKKYQQPSSKDKSWLDQADVMLITYGDGIQSPGQPPLATLDLFLNKYVKDALSAVHILPMFPYTSDDGFSVVDYRAIDSNLGDWREIDALGQSYDLMFDAVINHSSKSCPWFQAFLQDQAPYNQYYMSCDPEQDYSKVTRPRALPLLTMFETKNGPQYLWTTFSEDQVDLNYANPDVLVEMADLLAFYAMNKARFIRLDAIGFAWKEQGTSCMHLPQTHMIVKVLRQVLEIVAPGCIIITETNVPHRDNISYFGNGHDEAGLVYQFPLPPLTLYSFLKGDASILSSWAASLAPTTKDTTYFNFLASHDGIGMRPVEDLLPETERQMMVEQVLAKGGQVGFRSMPDGSQVPYELNINYFDAIAGEEIEKTMALKKYMASQFVLLSVMGMPAIYYHSLLGSRNCYEEFEKSGIKRRINREKLEYGALEKDLADCKSLRSQVLAEYKNLLHHRKFWGAFAPNSPQTILSLAPEVFAGIRGEKEHQILFLVNVSSKQISLSTSFEGVNIITQQEIENHILLSAYEYMWIKLR